MREIPMLYFWRGKNVDEMERDQLIQAIKELAKLADKHRAEEIGAAYNLLTKSRLQNYNVSILP